MAKKKPAAKAASTKNPTITTPPSDREWWENGIREEIVLAERALCEVRLELLKANAVAKQLKASEDSAAHHLQRLHEKLDNPQGHLPFDRPPVNPDQKTLSFAADDPNAAKPLSDTTLKPTLIAKVAKKLAKNPGDIVTVGMLEACMRDRPDSWMKFLELNQPQTDAVQDVLDDFRKKFPMPAPKEEKLITRMADGKKITFTEMLTEAKEILSGQTIADKVKKQSEALS